MIVFDSNPDLFIIPIIHWPIKWYGALFALGFFLGFLIFEKITYRFLSSESIRSNTARLEAKEITDRITLYVVIATAVGARLGHLLFYENPAEYLSHPLMFFQIWKGGLSSHGAAIGIIVGLFFASRFTKKIHEEITLWRLLDWIVVPTALAGAFIRIGNFINQEILGTPTSLPWGVIFMHPADGSELLPRHPVQLYEAAYYFLVFLVLIYLALKTRALFMRGRLFGLFLVLVFGFRFGIEYLKVEQSSFLLSFGTMGQLLSAPFFLFGLYLLIRKK